MIMSMCEENKRTGRSRPFVQIAVSNWELYCSRCPAGKKNHKDYLKFLAGLALGESIGKKRPNILILREKQLLEQEYVELFMGLWEEVKKYRKKGTAMLIPHMYVLAARQAGCGLLHLPLPLLREYRNQGRLSGLQTGTSIHSVQEAREAEKLGAAYVTAGHIFSTDCKKGVPPRDLEFLDQVCASVTIPVYAIGGIHEEHISRIQKTKAAGVCQMSEYMLGSAAMK